MLESIHYSKIIRDLERQSLEKLVGASEAQRLLSDTELTEYIIKHIFIRYFTGYFAKRIQASPDIG